MTPTSLAVSGLESVGAVAAAAAGAFFAGVSLFEADSLFIEGASDGIAGASLAAGAGIAASDAAAILAGSTAPSPAETAWTSAAWSGGVTAAAGFSAAGIVVAGAGTGAA